MKKNVLTVMFLFLIFSLFSQSVKFEKLFGGNGYDYGNSVVQTYDKGYVVAGTSSSFGNGSTDAYILKTDSLGNFLWHNTYGWINIDQLYSIEETNDSGLVVVGYTNSFGFGGYDMYLIKTDRLGNVEWWKTYGGNNWDFAYSVKQTNDGGYILAGGTYSYGAGDEDMFVVKTNSIGDTLWTKTYGGAEQDEAKSIIQTADGGYILTGFTKSFGDASGDIYTIKTDANGDTLWTYKFQGIYEDFSNQIIEKNNGDFIIGGSSKSIGMGGYDGVKIILNSAGNVIFSNYYGGSNDEEFYSIAESVGGRFAMLGYTKSYGVGLNDFVLYIENPYNGFHSGTFGGTNIDIGKSIKNTKDNGYIICGNSASYSALDHIYLIKTDSNGVASASIGIINTGVNNFNHRKSDLINIYPNPSSSYIEINKEKINSKNLLITLYNIFGEIVWSQKSEADKTRIDISFLSNGVYYLKVDADSIVISEKIIIQH